ncbi:MAG: NADH-quinone oxidoreductase subunit M [Acidiferrobacterales bacterium]|nr:NADH-quinone oxidoreductase subunit M [Acidiferrobacterales bacterium]
MSIGQVDQLSLVIWLPIIGAILVLAAGNQRREIARKIALGFSVGTFLLSLPLYIGFDKSTAEFQFVEHVEWVPAFNINYSIGIDGISLPLILLTTFLTVLVVIAGWKVVEYRVAHYMAAFLILEGLMIGVFSALDAILFYIFWEGMLIPMFLIIGIWGGVNRIYATIKFFLYTLLGSLLMLVAFLYLYNVSGSSFDIRNWHQLDVLYYQTPLFIAFFAAFAVKVPMVPVHTWLPDAHVEAPTGGSVILAAVMLKMGAYGFLRFSLPILPDASQALSGVMIALSLIAIVYIALVALAQTDMKKLIAYSSISHMGFVTLGFFIFNVHGIEGAIVQMISHGFVSGALFLCVGVLYDRLHSRKLETYGGVAHSMPMFAALMMIFTLANVGLPGTSGFVGELLVIIGTFEENAVYAGIAALTLILGAAYTLRMYKRVIYGKITNEAVAALKDLERQEVIALGLLAVLVVLLGVWPFPLLEVMHPSVELLVSQAASTKMS